MNVMERHVREAYERLRTKVPDFIDSPVHREDVIVYALNRLPAKYVVTDEGKAVTEAALDGAQHRAAIDVQILDAIRYVSLRPRTSAPPGGG